MGNWDPAAEPGSGRVGTPVLGQVWFASRARYGLRWAATSAAMMIMPSSTPIINPITN